MYLKENPAYKGSLAEVLLIGGDGLPIEKVFKGAINLMNHNQHNQSISE